MRASQHGRDQLKIGDCPGQGLMYTYALGVDSLERKAAENFALYFRRRQASTGKQSAHRAAETNCRGRKSLVMTSRAAMTSHDKP